MAKLKKRYAVRGEDSDETVLEPGMAGRDWDRVIDMKIHYWDADRRTDPAAEVVDGTVYLSIPLVDLQTGQTAVEVRHPALRLLDGLGGQATFRPLWGDRDEQEANRRLVRPALEAYEQSGKRQTVKWTAGEPQGGVHLLPKEMMPAGIPDSAYPGADELIDTDLLDSAGRARALVDLVRAGMARDNAGIVVLDYQLANWIGALDIGGSGMRWYKALGAFGLIGKWISAGEYESSAMLIDAGRLGETVPTAVWTLAWFRDQGIVSDDGEFSLGGIRLRPPKRDRADINDAFRNMARFYRMRHRQPVVLVVQPSLFDAVAAAAPAFAKSDELSADRRWKMFAREMRFGLLVCTQSADDTLDDRDMPFMVAESDFYWRVSHDEKPGIRRVELDAETLAADGFLVGGRLSYVNDDGIRVRLG